MTKNAMDEGQALALLKVLVDYQEGEEWTQCHHPHLLNAIAVARPDLMPMLPMSVNQPHILAAGRETEKRSKSREMLGAFLEQWGRALRRNALAVDFDNELDKLRNDYEEANLHLAALERRYDNAIDLIPAEFKRHDKHEGDVAASMREMLERLKTAAKLEAMLEGEEAVYDRLHQLVMDDQETAAGMPGTLSRRVIMEAAATLLERLRDTAAACIVKLDRAERALPLRFQSGGTVADCIKHLTTVYERTAKELDAQTDWLKHNCPWYPVGAAAPKPPPTDVKLFVMVEAMDGGHCPDVAMIDRDGEWYSEGIMVKVVAWRPIPKFTP